MKFPHCLTATLFACSAMTLGACAADDEVLAQDKTSQGEASTPTSPALAISMESLSATRTAPVKNQLITCEHTSERGMTTTWNALIRDGAVLSYSQMQNYSRPMCDPGQPDCAMGWQGEKVGSYFRTRSGALNQHLLDLETMTLERALTTKREGLEITQYTCTSSPFPEGIQFD